MADQRRFDGIEKVVRDARRKLDDVESTVLTRLASHAHTTDHAALTGLAADGHPQYLNLARGDARYVRADTLYGHARYRASTAQSITSSVVTKVAFGITIDSAGGDVSQSAGTTDFTLLRAGVWLIEAAVSWPARTGVSFRALIIGDSANSATVYGEQTGNNNGGGFTNSAIATKRFAFGAVLSAYCYQESGTALLTAPSSEKVHISFTWLRP